MTGLIAALVGTSAYSQHREAGDVYLGAAIGYHIAPEAKDRIHRRFEAENAEIQERLDAEWGNGVASVSGILSSLLEDDVVGWGFHGGFAVADSLALEAGYLGSTDMEVTVRRAVDGAEGKADLTTSAFYAAVVGHFPMPHGSVVHPFVKVGLAHWNSQWSFRVDRFTVPRGYGIDQSVRIDCFTVSEHEDCFGIDDFTVSEDEDYIDPLFAIGVDVPAFETVSFRGEYVILWVGGDEGGNHYRFQAGVDFTF